MKDISPELVELVRKTDPNKIAEEIVTVQPMPDNIDLKKVCSFYVALQNYIDRIKND